jgi:type 1 glutamine amidotransferase
MRTASWVLAAGVLLLGGLAWAAPPYKALIIDGQNNHNWKATTPILKKILEETNLFQVDVVTAPPGKDLAEFKPKFTDYQVVVSNYNGNPWSRETERAFVEYVNNGGGFVSVHAANNSFPQWTEYNEIIGLGGWGGRNEKSGPYIRIKDGKVVRDESAGGGGHHGRPHEFVLETFDKEHPIMAGLPAKWKHTQDELYDRLRGPAKNLTVLATAYSDPATGGTGENEPLLMAISYGKGRIFHTALGHDVPALKCAGFQVTLQRGAEWAATGKVTQKVPDDFPTADKAVSRP